MKNLWMIAALILPFANAHAVTQGEVTRCWFETEIECSGGDCEREEVRCKAKIVDQILDPDTVIMNIVRLEVECTNGFDLEDEYAQKLNEGDKTFVLGEERGDTALVTMKNILTHLENNETVPASLVISDHDEALKLRGKCKSEGIPLPPPSVR